MNRPSWLLGLELVDLCAHMLAYQRGSDLSSVEYEISKKRKAQCRDRFLRACGLILPSVEVRR